MDTKISFRLLRSLFLHKKRCFRIGKFVSYLETLCHIRKLAARATKSLYEAGGMGNESLGSVGRLVQSLEREK